jgi:hypothetical protein
MNLAMINEYAKARKMGDAEKIIYESVVMHKGWDMDNAACLVRMKDGSHKMFTTNHGAVCEMKGDSLNQLVKEAASYMRDIQSLLELAQEKGAVKKPK